MPQNPHVLDYEPVMRSRAEAHRPEPDFEADEDVEAPLRPLAKADETDDKFFDNSESKAVQEEQTKTIIKKGHGLTYFSFMVFTALVFIRPYEIFPSMKWTAATAFWIGLATMLIYFPAQLALEGKLSIQIKPIKLIVILLSIGLLSVPLATNRMIAWLAFVEYAKVVLTFIIVANVLRTERRFRLLIMLMLVVSCWMSIAALNDYRMARFALPGQRIEGVIGGLFDNPNDMALHLMTMIPITVAFFITSRHILAKFIYPICIAIMLAGIVASFSRGGVLGLIAAIGFMSWRLARRNRGLFLAGALVFCVLFFALAPGDFQARMTLTGDSSSNARTNDLKRSIFIMVHHPLLGVGMDNYILFSNTDHATHNSYTQVGAEMGMPALAVYMMFLFSALRPLRRVNYETGQPGNKSRYRYLAAGLEASLVGYMVASFFASIAYLWYLYYLIGYTICIVRLYEASKSSALPERARAGGSLPGRMVTNETVSVRPLG